MTKSPLTAVHDKLIAASVEFYRSCDELEQLTRELKSCRCTMFPRTENRDYTSCLNGLFALQRDSEEQNVYRQTMCSDCQTAAKVITDRLEVRSKNTKAYYSVARLCKELGKTIVNVKVKPETTEMAIREIDKAVFFAKQDRSYVKSLDGIARRSAARTAKARRASAKAAAAREALKAA